MTDRASRDEELVRRYLAGDAEAFDELMRAHEDRVFAVCLRMLRDREAALDATQETFLSVLRKADRFSGRFPDPRRATAGSVEARPPIDAARSRP